MKYFFLLNFTIISFCIQAQRFNNDYIGTPPRFGRIQIGYGTMALSNPDILTSSIKGNVFNFKGEFRIFSNFFDDENRFAIHDGIVTEFNIGNATTTSNSMTVTSQDLSFMYY